MGACATVMVGLHKWGGVNLQLAYSSEVGSIGLKRPYMSVRHQLELYRFGSIHNILVSLFREHPETMHGHNATT